MDLGLTGKVAMVMAASQGLGKAVALGLAREGASVSICARNEEKLALAAADISGQTQARVLAVPADVSQSDQLATWVQRTTEELGPPQIVVTNTGSPAIGNLSDVGDQDWRAAIDSILLSVARIANLVTPVMKTAGWGRMITLTSAQVKMPQDRMLLSVAVRNGVIGMTRSLANELAPFGITVNSVLPGKIWTERTPGALQVLADKQGISVSAAEARLNAEVPAKRFGTSQEFADAVVFLASVRASWITGVSLRVDGGFCKALD